MVSFFFLVSFSFSFHNSLSACPPSSHYANFMISPQQRNGTAMNARIRCANRRMVASSILDDAQQPMGKRYQSHLVPIDTPLFYYI